MSEKRWTTIDKTGWGEGPWLTEPDKIQWVDWATGLDCLIVRSNPHIGSLCGYVGLPPNHPLHGSDYKDMDFVDVYGGLTFADSCLEGFPEGEGVCHVPEPGRPKDVWWLGFDCGHFMDLSPAFEIRDREMRQKHGWPDTIEMLPSELGGYATGLEKTYKPVPYVRAEVEHLAKQVATKQLPSGECP